YGADCIVTPPSLLPQEYGNRVKTDRRDSRKLAYLLAKGMLRRVWVPTLEERYHRQVIRRRRQLIGDRVRTQNRIKAELRFYGVELVEPRGPWPRVYVERLWSIRFGNRWMQESFQRLLEQYEFLTEQIAKQTQLLRELSETPCYRERVEILRSVPGIGLIAAMDGAFGGASGCGSFQAGRAACGICGFDAIAVFQCGEDPHGSDYGGRQERASGDTGGGLVEVDHQGWGHAGQV
nr:transposase [Deltaproteobacteria bacterium]